MNHSLCSSQVSFLAIAIVVLVHWIPGSNGQLKNLQLYSFSTESLCTTTLPLSGVEFFIRTSTGLEFVVSGIKELAPVNYVVQMPLFVWNQTANPIIIFSVLANGFAIDPPLGSAPVAFLQIDENPKNFRTLGESSPDCFYGRAILSLRYTSFIPATTGTTQFTTTGLVTTTATTGESATTAIPTTGNLGTTSIDNSESGESSEDETSTTGEGKQSSESSFFSSIAFYAIIGSVGGVLLLSALVVAALFARKNRKNKRNGRQTVELAPMEGTQPEAKRGEEWEIDPSEIQFKGKIGEGNFFFTFFFVCLNG
jgi:hypothetical protein